MAAGSSPPAWLSGWQSLAADAENSEPGTATIRATGATGSGRRGSNPGPSRTVRFSDPEQGHFLSQEGWAPLSQEQSDALGVQPSTLRRDSTGFQVEQQKQQKMQQHVTTANEHTQQNNIFEASVLSLREKLHEARAVLARAVNEGDDDSDSGPDKSEAEESPVRVRSRQSRKRGGDGAGGLRRDSSLVTLLSSDKSLMRMASASVSSSLTSLSSGSDAGGPRVVAATGVAAAANDTAASSEIHSNHEQQQRHQQRPQQKGKGYQKYNASEKPFTPVSFSSDSPSSSPPLSRKTSSSSSSSATSSNSSLSRQRTSSLGQISEGVSSAQENSGESINDNNNNNNNSDISRNVKDHKDGPDGYLTSKIFSKDSATSSTTENPSDKDGFSTSELRRPETLPRRGKSSSSMSNASAALEPSNRTDGHQQDSAMPTLKDQKESVWLSFTSKSKSQMDLKENALLRGSRDSVATNLDEDYQRRQEYRADGPSSLPTGRRMREIGTVGFALRKSKSLHSFRSSRSLSNLAEESPTQSNPNISVGDNNQSKSIKSSSFASLAIADPSSSHALQQRQSNDGSQQMYVGRRRGDPKNLQHQLPSSERSSRGILENGIASMRSSLLSLQESEHEEEEGEEEGGEERRNSQPRRSSHRDYFEVQRPFLYSATGRAFIDAAQEWGRNDARDSTEAGMIKANLSDQEQSYALKFNEGSKFDPTSATASDFSTENGLSMETTPLLHVHFDSAETNHGEAGVIIRREYGMVANSNATKKENETVAGHNAPQGSLQTQDASKETSDQSHTDDMHAAAGTTGASESPSPSSVGTNSADPYNLKNNSDQILHQTTSNKGTNGWSKKSETQEMQEKQEQKLSSKPALSNSNTVKSSPGNATIIASKGAVQASHHRKNDNYKKRKHPATDQHQDGSMIKKDDGEGKLRLGDQTVSTAVFDSKKSKSRQLSINHPKGIPKVGNKPAELKQQSVQNREENQIAEALFAASRIQIERSTISLREAQAVLEGRRIRRSSQGSLQSLRDSTSKEGLHNSQAEQDQSSGYGRHRYSSRHHLHDHHQIQSELEFDVLRRYHSQDTDGNNNNSNNRRGGEITERKKVISLSRQDIALLMSLPMDRKSKDIEYLAQNIVRKLPVYKNIHRELHRTVAGALRFVQFNPGRTLVKTFPWENSSSSFYYFLSGSAVVSLLPVTSLDSFNNASASWNHLSIASSFSSFMGSVPSVGSSLGSLSHQSLQVGSRTIGSAQEETQRAAGNGGSGGSSDEAGQSQSESQAGEYSPTRYSSTMSLSPEASPHNSNFTLVHTASSSVLSNSSPSLPHASLITMDANESRYQLANGGEHDIAAAGMLTPATSAPILSASSVTMAGVANVGLKKSSQGSLATKGDSSSLLSSSSASVVPTSPLSKYSSKSISKLETSAAEAASTKSHHSSISSPAGTQSARSYSSSTQTGHSSNSNLGLHMPDSIFENVYCEYVAGDHFVGLPYAQAAQKCAVVTIARPCQLLVLDRWEHEQIMAESLKQRPLTPPDEPASAAVEQPAPLLLPRPMQMPVASSSTSVTVSSSTVISQPLALPSIIAAKNG